MDIFDPLEFLADWSDRFSRRDSGGLAAFYRDDALFYGSNDSLLIGRTAIQAYFAALPAEGAASARFGDLAVSRLSGTSVAVGGLVYFVIGQISLTMRITLLFVEGDGEWLIGMHHASMLGMLPNERRSIN
ncbi:MAG: nuclear transport factor 2 family protein [Novosphingobium sp.]